MEIIGILVVGMNCEAARSGKSNIFHSANLLKASTCMMAKNNSNP